MHKGHRVINISQSELVEGLEMVCMKVPDHARANYVIGDTYVVMRMDSRTNNYDVKVSDNTQIGELDNPEDFGYYWYYTEITKLNILVPKKYVTDEDIFALKMGVDL